MGEMQFMWKSGVLFHGKSGATFTRGEALTKERAVVRCNPGALSTCQLDKTWQQLTEFDAVITKKTVLDKT